MPPLLCPRCERAQPSEALYCHFDGAYLRLPEGGVDPRRLPIEFVFVSGRRCRSYDELVEGCLEDWEVARTHLQQGVFRQFFTGAGRLDLAHAAEEGQNFSDPDLGLNHFLKKLPATTTHAPRLDLNPRRLILGTLRIGAVEPVRLTIINQGRGLLVGTLTVAEGNDWLSIVPASPSLVSRDPEGSADSALPSGSRLTGGNEALVETVVKTASEQEIVLQVDTRRLTAPQKYFAKLTLITNGGVVEVPVHVAVAAHPFPEAPLQGADSPRALAQRMQAQPKASVPLLESGAVARWFALNGWNYPVASAPARGVGAVQQFFEAMGLAKPPVVRLSAATLEFHCVYPEVVEGRTLLQTAARKWVYAQVESDVPWVRVASAHVSGPQQTAIDVVVDSSLLEPGSVNEGLVHVSANGGQQLVLRVRVDVQRPHEPFTRRLLRPFITGALAGLFFRLLLAGPADVYARVLARVLAPPVDSAPLPGSPGHWLSTLFVDRGPAPAWPAGSLVSWLYSPLAAEGFVRHFVMATWWLGAVSGALLLWRRGSRLADVPCGAIAGAVAGIAGSATLACLLPLLDGPPRFAWQFVAAAATQASLPQTAWLWTPLWIATAALCWTIVGAVCGFALGRAGDPGTRLLATAVAPLAWLLRGCGLTRLALLFA